MNIKKGIKAFVSLGKKLQLLADNFEKEEKFIAVLNKARIANSWFTVANQLKAVTSLTGMLAENEMEKWISKYTFNANADVKTVGIICAGNIPAVAFHDILCVLVSGNKALIKLSSDDSLLIPFLLDMLLETEPGFKVKIEFAERIKNPDAVIATGSNNSARYFEFYFGKYPHIIRKNRNGVAILTGNETEEDFKKLGADIFNYFGLGCRNVSKLYVPENYSFNNFFKVIEPKGKELMEHNKYMNNYDYHNALFLLERIPFLTNNFLIVKEDHQIASPVSVINFEYYSDKNNLKEKITSNAEYIQCIVSKEKITGSEIDYGTTQQPALWDYADGVDTLGFLVSLK